VIHRLGDDDGHQAVLVGKPTKPRCAHRLAHPVSRPWINCAIDPALNFLESIRRGELPHVPIADLWTLYRSIRAGPHGVPRHARPAALQTRSAACTAAMRRRCSTRASAVRVHTMLPAGKGYTTLELKINFIRPFD